MPIYEYECQACRHRFERRQSFRDDPIKVCPECGGATRRLLQAPPIIFKGSGWYATDYASPERKKAIEGEKKGADGSPGTSRNEGKAKTEKSTSDQQPPPSSSSDQD